MTMQKKIFKIHNEIVTMQNFSSPSHNFFWIFSACPCYKEFMVIFALGVFMGRIWMVCLLKMGHFYWNFGKICVFFLSFFVQSQFHSSFSLHFTCQPADVWNVTGDTHIRSRLWRDGCRFGLLYTFSPRQSASDWRGSEK